MLLLALTSAMGCEDWDNFWNKRSLEQDLALMRDPIFADERRSGIAGLQRRDELLNPEYQAELRRMAAGDPNGMVRAQATRALNQARDVQAKPIFLSLLADPEPRVRLEAAKALRNLPDDRAVPRLIELANDTAQDRDVRIWCVFALSSYRRMETARALVPMLGAKDYSVAFEARCSLRRMTGRDYHQEQGLWLKYLAAHPDSFIPMPATQPYQW